MKGAGGCRSGGGAPGGVRCRNGPCERDSYKQFGTIARDVGELLVGSIRIIMLSTEALSSRSITV